MAVVVLVGSVAVLVALLQLPPIATVVVRKLLTLAPFNPGSRLEVGRVSGNFLRGLTLEDVRLRQSGRELAHIQRLKVGYHLPRLRPPATRIDELSVEGGQVATRRGPDGWDLLQVLRKSADTTGGGALAIGILRVRDVSVAAELAPDSVAHLRLQDLLARSLVLSDTTLVKLDDLKLAVQPPGSGRWVGLTTRGDVTAEEIRLDPVRMFTESSELRGRLIMPRGFRDARQVDRLDVRLVAQPLDLADLAAFSPSVPDSGLLRFDARAAGDGDLVTAHLAASLDRGRLTLDGGTRLRDGKPTSYTLRGSMSRVDLSRLSTAAPPGELNARVDADIAGPLRNATGNARLQIDASKLGTVMVHRVDLGAAMASGTADLTLRGALDTGSISATGRARPFDSIPTYRVSGTARHLPGTAALARAATGTAGDPSLAVAFRLSGAGSSADSATVEGRVDLAAVRDTGPQVDMGHATLRLASGRLTLRPELLAGGGTITALAVVTLGDTVAYEVRQGRIERVDLARLSGDTLTAPLTGRFSVAGRGTAPAEARLTANIHFDELRYGQRRVERVDVTARLDRGRLRVEGDGALQGGRLVLEALGHPFDRTASYVLRRAALEAVDLGTLLGQPRFAGPVTLSVTGEARMRGTSRALQGHVTVDASRMGNVRVSRGEGNVRLTGEQLAYDAAVETNGGGLWLAGDGTMAAAGRAPTYRVRDGRLTGVDLGELLGRPDLRTDVNATFTAEVAGGSPDSLRGRLALVLQPSRVNQAELTGGTLDAQMNGRNLSAKIHADGPDAALDATLTGTPSAERTALESDGTLRLEHLARWTGRRDADGRVESRFALDLVTDSLGLRSVGGSVDAIGGIGGVRVPAARVTLTPVDGQLQLDTVMLRSNVAVMDGGGRLQLRPGSAPGTLLLRATLGDLAPVAALLGSDTVGFDSARVKLAVTGPAWGWRMDGGADAHGLAFGGNLANRVTLTAAATLDSTRLRAVSGDLHVEDAAYGDLTVRELTATGGYDSTVALDLNVNIADSVRVATRIRGTVSMARDTVRLELQRLALTEGGRDWALERPARIMFGPRVEIDGLALRAGERSITANGVLDRQGSSDLTFGIAALDLEALRAAGLVPIGGRVDGQLHLTGPAAAPRLQGKMGLAIVSDGGRELGRVSTDLDWTGAGLRLAAAATPTSGGALTIQGTLPYRLTLTPKDTSATVGSEPTEADTVSLAVRADSFDLALFQPLLPPDAATGLHGKLQADARIGGSIRKASATGTVGLSRGALKLPAIGMAYERGTMVGRLEGDALRIERLQLFTGKDKELSASGAVHLRPLSEPALELDATLKHFTLVNSDQLKTAASGQIRLGGTVLKPALSGRLRLDKTNFFIGTEAAQAKVEHVDLTDAELRDLARHFGPGVLARGKENTDLMDRVKLDLAIQMPRRVWIRRSSAPKTNIELMGSLRVTQEPGGEMQFFGRAEPVPDRGTIELNGREFRLNEGDINLAGPVDSTKHDVTASYQAPTQSGGDNEGVLIYVHAKGRLDSLGLEFTSDPSMNQDDILSYIVTGRPTSDNPLFEGSGGGSSGKEMAVGALASAISNSAGQGLGLDVFQIRQEPTRGLTLTAGRYLGSRLFLDLQLPLGSQSQQTSGANLGPGFELEYTLERWLRANLRGGSLPPGLLFRARRAY